MLFLFSLLLLPLLLSPTSADAQFRHFTVEQPQFQNGNLTFGKSSAANDVAVFAFTGCAAPLCRPFSDLVVQLGFKDQDEAKHTSKGSRNGGKDNGGDVILPVWTTSRLSEPRAEGCATTFTSSFDNTSYVLMAGGHNDSAAYVATTDVFRISQNMSEAPQLVDTMQLSLGRELLGCVTASDYNLSFFAGGKKPHPIPGMKGETDVVDILNHTDMTWTISHLSVSRKKVEATRAGRFLLFAGGELSANATGFGDYSSTVDLFDLETHTWSTAELSVPRQYFAITSVGNYAIFAGGFANDNSVTHLNRGHKIARSWAGHRSDVVDIFDSNTQKWSVARLAEPRSNFDAVSINGRWGVFGGGTPDRINPRSSTVDIFDATTGVWSVTNLTHPGNPSAARAGNRAIFQGGSNTNVVDVFEFA